MDQGLEIGNTAGVDGELLALNSDINKSAKNLHGPELAAMVEKYQLLARHRQNVANLATAFAVIPPRAPQTNIRPPPPHIQKETWRDTIDVTQESCATATIKHPALSTQQQQSQSQHYEDMDTDDGDVSTERDNSVHLDGEEEETVEERERPTKEAKGKSKKILYTDDEARIVWQFGQEHKDKNWEILAAEALKKPRIFDHTHANARSLQNKWKWMTRSSESKAKFKSKFKKDRVTNQRQEGGTGTRKPRGGRRGTMTRRKYSNVESAIVWRFGMIEGKEDWENLAARVSTMSGTFHRSHMSAGSLKKKFMNMKDPNVVKRYREKFGGDLEAHNLKGWAQHTKL